MKASLNILAAAVSLTLASISAHAALAPPNFGTGAPGGTGPVQSGLFLAIFDTASNASDVVNLNYDEQVVTLASGNLNPSAAGSPFSLAANPTGASGQVLQIDFGVVPGFSTVFNSGTIGTSAYLVGAGFGAGAGTEQAVVTSATTPVTAYGGVGTLINSLQTEIAAWQGNFPTQNFLTDTTGSPVTSPQNFSLRSGQLIPGQSFSGAVGTALQLYNITTTTGHRSVINTYSNGSGTDGFFFLATNGDLTYNIGTAGTTVPLPAAAWLLGSGLLGLAGIGRRRRAAVA